MSTTVVELAPINDADVPAVAAFLHEHLNSRLPAGAWARAMQVPWTVNAPNYGFMLRHDGQVVGAYLAFYSDRVIDGQPRQWCNLGAWCVLPEHRFAGLRLVKAMLAQPGYDFTDLSPSGAVVGLNTRLGFEFVESVTDLMLNLPWPAWPGRSVVSCDPDLIQSTVTGKDLRIYRDHVGTAAARHVVLIRGDEWCYVVFRKDRRKNLPLFASLLHVSNPALFARMVRPLARHLLLRHGVVASLVESQIVPATPGPSFRLRSPRRKMFRSASLKSDQIDYLYSELACVAW